MSLQEAINNRLKNESYMVPHLDVILTYMPGCSSFNTSQGALKELDSPKYLSRIDFYYYIPTIDKDVILSAKKLHTTYVFGAVMDLKEFQCLYNMNNSLFELERNFSENKDNTEKVCLSRVNSENKYPVLAIDDNFKVFGTLQEMVEAAKDFISTMEEFYSIVRIENHCEEGKLMRIKHECK